jgi:chromosomal replication initiation ATPase DnaA
MIKKIIEEHGLNTPSRKEELVYKRFVFWNYLYNKLGMTLEDVGKEFNRNHSSVIYGIRKYNDLIIYDDFKKMATEFEDEIDSILSVVNAEAVDSLTDIEVDLMNAKNVHELWAVKKKLMNSLC